MFLIQDYMKSLKISKLYKDEKKKSTVPFLQLDKLAGQTLYA